MRIRFLLIGVLVVGGLASCTTTGFEVGSLSIEPEEISVGETFTVEADVSNRGEIDGTFTATLKLDETMFFGTKEVWIAAGDTETVSFNCFIETPGFHSLKLNGSTTTFTAYIPFPDSNLEAVIREAINKPNGPINVFDLEPITTLTAQEKGISDLTGLEYCVNLQVLELRDNNISNISPLSSLINLRELGLWGNNISDISPLEGLNNLKILHLHENNIVDISPLANLTYLGILHLPNNNISNISPLAGLTYLAGLDIEGNNISDISPLEGLTKLMDLSLKANNISDISPLAGLIEMHILHIHQNNISDISLLVENSGLGEGDEIYLENNNLDLTESSEDMQNIRTLQDRGVEVIY
jgi:Leucine-rich repeat (LRR) protein